MFTKCSTLVIVGSEPLDLADLIFEKSLVIFFCNFLSDIVSPGTKSVLSTSDFFGVDKLHKTDAEIIDELYENVKALHTENQRLHREIYDLKKQQQTDKNMGYMGMDNWEDSDCAADFVYAYKKASTMAQRRKLIDVELKDFANSYNTPGSVNIALAMEGGVVRRDDLTAKQLNKLRRMQDTRTYEYAEKLKLIRKQYAPPAQPPM